MQIEIDVPRPFLTLGLIAAIGWGAYYVSVQGTAAYTAGVNTSGEAVRQSAVADYADIVSASVGEEERKTRGSAEAPERREAANGAEEKIRQGRSEQEMLRRKADILRGQVRILEAERRALGENADPRLELQFENATRILKSLLQDQRRAEEYLLASLRQLWEAQERAQILAVSDEGGDEPLTLAWPVAPRLGISAGFLDPAYEELFGFEHDAVDIPVSQGSEVRAAADGIVEEVSDHGLGFNSITVRHAGGAVTLYGHILEFKVRIGNRVRAGDVLGLSGGRPGTPGAGLSTGPHLHFGLFRDGVAVDPMGYLPPVASVVKGG